ncbi:MAG: TolC family protein [Ignavibacteriae bacterium]|nr:TolC family protein [Ignavibacteriota bacterium]
MKKTAGILLIIFFFNPVFIGSQVLDLKTAINVSMEKNDKIKQYKEKINQKDEDNKEAMGNFLPAINLTASFNHLNDNMNIDLDQIRQAMVKLQAGNQVEFKNIYTIINGGQPLTSQQRAQYFSAYSNALYSAIPPFVEQFKKQDNWYTTLTGAQPLYMGGKVIAAKKYANLEKVYSEIELEKIKNVITSEVINNYLNVVLVKNVIKTREDVLEGMKRHRSDAKRLYDEGLIAKHQYLRSEVAVADAERILFDEENRLQLALIALKNTIGYKENEIVEINDSLVYRSIDDSLKAIKEYAYENQPVLKLIKIKKDETVQKYKIERSEFLPKIMLYGKYELIDSYLSQLEPRWTVGIQGSINLFNGFKNYHRIQSTKYLQSEVDYLYSDTKSKISLLVEKNFKDMQNYKNRYFKLNVNIQLADENLRLTSARFQTGLGTSLDVIDAELSLEKNLVERQVSICEYYKAINELYLASGNPKKYLEIWNNKEYLK